ncbi:hypothetical protein APHAL10511_005066 [Amanita phalloides]|nr:hypothetical protein APHAL10511_005066 [Amanita phalloides]
MKFTVFLGAPSPDCLQNSSFSWRTVTNIPDHTYEAASVRISNFYQNTIFHDDEDPVTDVPSFLLHDTSSSSTLPDSTQLSSASISRTQSFCYTRSIAHFPSFHFNPNCLSSLSLLTRIPAKVTLLLAVMEVDGPDMVKIKKGRDAGKEVGVLRLIVGDEEGRVGKLTAWREVAVAWGGHVEGSTAVKRGDVVLIESVNGSRDAQTSPSLTASPYLGSKLTLCYRTLPRGNEDHRFSPDLRLGASDAAVRKVAAVVKWFKKMAGL